MRSHEQYLFENLLKYAKISIFKKKNIFELKFYKFRKLQYVYICIYIVNRILAEH